MNKFIITLALILAAQLSFSQNFTMSNGSGSGCVGNFLDPGGSGNYSNNQNITYTFCTSSPGSQLVFNFTAFNIENSWDFLTIYNGNSTAAPTLGTYTGTIGPGVITSNNPNGCLTFVFTSDFSGTGPGWTAQISCASPCQDIVSVLASSTPGISGGLYIDVCQGQSINLVGSGNYPQNNTSYAQSNGTSTFSWNFGDGTPNGSGINVNHTYGSPGIYDLDLNILDIQNCPNSNDLQIFIRVADDPTFTGTQATIPAICLGETNTLSGFVTPTEIVLDCTPPVAGLTFLPDGSGASYETAVQVDCFGLGQTLTSASQLQSICVDMEHSYLGDLNIVIECPNGQTATLKAYPGGGGTYLGNPIDNTTGGPGTGFTYCFDNFATTLLVNGPTVTSGTPAGNSVAAGTYMPVQSFSNLIGCPLNGAWTLIITDNLGADDGYIFGWNMAFDPSIVPPTYTHTPAITSQGWQADPTITSTAGNTITVQPTVSGISCYTYQATDEFGCNYDTTVCFTVNPPGSAGCPACFITNFTANSVLANCGTEYTTTGIVEFSSSPGSGNLIIEDCQGNQTIAQSFPFSSPANYTLTGTDANGNPCFFRAYFSAVPTCELIINFTYPAFTPADEAGTINANQTGVGLTTFILCDQDGITVTSNNDWAIPPIAPGNDPGLGYLIYSCPPSAGGFGIDPGLDPCYVGFINITNFSLINNGGSADAFLASLGALTNQTFYIVPMTFGSLSNVTYQQDCYDLDITQTVTVQYLNPIVPVIAQNCVAGTATITLTGGNPQFNGGNYTASGLLPATASFSNTTAGSGGTIGLTGLINGDNWSFTVTDNNGCPQVVSGTFTGVQNAAFTYPSNTYCASAANPSPNITGVSGGTFSSTAGLSLNAGTGLINLAASTPGTYTVTYTTPGPTCQGTATFIITINPLPIVNAGPDQTVCQGTSVTLSGSGANTYVWNNGVSNGVSFTPAVGSINYTVTGTTTATGCTNTDIVNVTVNALPIVNAGPDQSVCQGSSVTLSGSGASSYTWNNGVTNGVAFSPAVGSLTYTVTGTNAALCASTDQVIVTVNPFPVVNAGPDQSICTGGSVTLAGSGAVSYVWNNGVTNNVAFVPAATTTYTVTGTDANGCVNTDQVTVTVLNTAPINAGPDVSICNGASTILSASGGVSYTWNNGLGVGNNFNVSPVSTTTYIVNGTDASGCAGSDQITVTVNPLPIVGAGPDQTVCENTNVTLSGTGATGYVWNNGVTNGTPFIQAVGTTTYTVTGTDGNGCVNIDQVNITVNPLPIINAGPDQTVCAGTAVTLSGAGAPTLVWNNGVTNNVAFTPAATLTYTLTGTSAAGCVSTDQAIVTVNPLPLVGAGPDVTVCNGSSVTLNGSGATGYAWNNGISNGVAFTQPIGTVNYTVTGTDGNGCVNTDQVSVTVNPNPNPIINGANVYCTGFSSNLTTSAAFTTYNWSTGSNASNVNVTTANNPINVTVTNAFGCSATSANFTVSENNTIVANFTEEICQGQSIIIHGTSQNTSGTYSQTFTSGTGCDSTSNVTLTVNPLPNVNGGTDVTVCTPQQITLTAAGATSYVWDNGITNGVPFNQAVGTTTYTVTGTDGNGCVNTDMVDVTVNPLPIVSAGPDFAVCNGDPATLSGSGASSYVWNLGVTNNVPFTPVATNTYTVTGTDANGCINTDQVTVTVNPFPNVDAGADQTVCSGAMVTLNGSGATSYVWDNGVTNGVAFTPASTATYTVTGTDGNGCVNTDQMTVTVNTLPIIDAGTDVTVCDNVPVTLNGNGVGNGPFGYVWDNGVINGTPFNQAVGTTTYTVTGTDVFGCVNTDDVDVTVNALPVVNAGPDQQVCEGASVNLSGSGANSYTWNNGVMDNVAFNPANGTLTYTVTGTDANGCTNTDMVDVTAIANPTVFAGNDFTICEGESITLTGSGANSYAWDNGVNNGVAFIPSSTTTYMVTGTFTGGCTDDDDITVTVNPLPVPTYTVNNLIGCSPVQATLESTTPNSASCVWTFSNGTVVNGCGPIVQTFTSAGCYDVTLEVTSNDGCVSSITTPNQICVEANPTAAFVPTPQIVTTSNLESTMDNNSSNADNYQWTFFDDGATTTFVNPTHTFPEEPGTYEILLVATTSYGCSDTAIGHVTVKEDLLFYVPNTFTPDDDQFNQTFNPIFTAGFDPYDYTLYIFNRWGEIIFESHDAEIGWDGTYAGEIVKEGVYTWKIIFKTSVNDERKEVVGHLTLLR